jgi:hypothetical protein
MRSAISTLAFVIWLCLTGAALAGSSQLAYQAVVHLTQEHHIDVTSRERHRVGIAAFRGIAIFADGELADYRYDGTYDFQAGSGSFHGYAIWRFEDGSEIRSTYSGKAETSGEGITFSGAHQVLSGSGRFEEATGTGAFQGRRIDAFEDGGDTYWSGELSLQTP